MRYKQPFLYLFDQKYLNRWIDIPFKDGSIIVFDMQTAGKILNNMPELRSADQDYQLSKPK